MKALLIPLMTLSLACSVAQAQQAEGRITANGHSAELKYSQAFEIDSVSEPGYMDVLVVLSDRPLAPALARDYDKLTEMSHKEGLSAIVLKLNPDARVMSAAPLNPGFTNHISSSQWVSWQPSAYNEKSVAGRVYTDGEQREFGQQWRYDVKFSAPITLDPAARSQ